MTTPMTEEQRARWARRRAMGRTRFMLIGILLYGVPCSVLTLFWNYFLGGTLWHHLSVFIIFAALVGVSIGWLEWRKQERRFAEATAASSSLPPATPPSPAPPAATPPHRRNSD